VHDHIHMFIMRDSGAPVCIIIKARIFFYEYNITSRVTSVPRGFIKACCMLYLTVNISRRSMQRFLNVVSPNTTSFTLPKDN
jgi:hypothetical protein